MSLITARAAALAALAYDIDDALTPVVVLDCADLAALADGDIAAAARQLAALTAPQLVTQAHAYAAYTNAIDPEAALNGADVLAIFQRCIAKHAPPVLPTMAWADRIYAAFMAPNDLLYLGLSTEEQTLYWECHNEMRAQSDADYNARRAARSAEIARTQAAPSPALVSIPALLDALCAAVDAARAATDDSRWTTAIDTAFSWLLQQEQIVFDRATHALTVTSPSGKTYRANGVCQCDAFARQNACWHRAAARLVRRALAAERALAAGICRQCGSVGCPCCDATRSAPFGPSIAERLANVRAARLASGD